MLWRVAWQCFIAWDLPNCLFPTFSTARCTLCHFQHSPELRLLLQCRVAKFNGVHTLTLHIPENFGADHTTLTFIGIKGDLTEVSLLLCLSLHSRGSRCTMQLPSALGRWAQFPCGLQ